MSQAPGLFGTPDSGHCSSAATSESWARSSAAPTSCTIRARLAMSLGDSIRQTASMALCVALAVVIQEKDRPRERPALSPGVCLHLPAQRLLALPQLGRELGAEVVGLEHLADLDLRLGARERIRSTLHPLDRLLFRLDLDQPEAGDQFLRLRERSVDHGALGSREPHARAP